MATFIYLVSPRNAPMDWNVFDNLENIRKSIPITWGKVNPADFDIVVAEKEDQGKPFVRLHIIKKSTREVQCDIHELPVWTAPTHL